MKTALCMSGQARGVINGWSSICGNLMNQNTPDVFVHVWGEDNDEQVIAIRNLYKPVAMVVECQRHFSNSLIDVDRQRTKYPHGASRDDFVDRVYSLFYSLLQSNLIKEIYRLENNINYDCVIRGRFDCSFSIPIKCSDFDMSVIHLLDKCLPEMVDDRFAFGPTDMMNIYSSAFCFYDKINKIRSSGNGIFCAETILYELLNSFGIKYRFIPSLQMLRVPLE